ncbi:PKD domain-containing protein [Fulvivirga aurantia]|uniref:PKD domain-containing protein n=1 Tax=Fulvivirga aurantia TaxID=2529383 RepID=UPI001CA39E32|nr:PKD domain-containing protein [Fulvivirga aurantia]
MCFEVGGNTECFIVISPQLTGGKPSWGVSLIDGVFDYVFNGPYNYRIDLSRVYLTGLSLGSNGVYKYAYMSTNDPNKLAAISPIAAWGDTNKGCILSEREIPLWAFHGDKDNTVGYNGGLAMFNSVVNCTSPVPTAELIFTTYENVGHNSWSRAYRTDNSLHTPNLYEWMLSKSLPGKPTANAGADQQITLPTNSITINGSGSDLGGSITSYSWIKISGPTATLTNASTPNITASNLVAGTYVFELTVTDNDGNTASDQMSLIVNPEVSNIEPVANAGSDILLELPINSTNITGTATDNDGTIVSVLWTQQSGPSTATISGQSTNTISVSDLIEGVYTFRFSIEDDAGATDFDEVNVEVVAAAANVPPTANAGSDKSLQLPTNTIVLNGSGSDTDGSISTYEWVKVSGPGSITITNANNPSVTLSDLVQGVYKMQLTVTDNDGAVGIDDVLINVIAANQNPIANAGPDITLTLPTNSTNISGSSSDNDGSIQSYLWSQLSGPNSATLTNSNNPLVSVSGLVEGVYTFNLEVEDNQGATSSDNVKVTVNSAPVNSAPTADAGDDINITLPTNSTTIVGSGSDSDGSISAYLWTKVSGPTTFTLSGQNTSTATVSGLIAGTYGFRLRVTDNDGATGTDEVLINVAPESVNESPTANAGPDKALTLPTNSTLLVGSGTDPDGSVSNYQWMQLSGPSSATLTNANTEDLNVADLIEGTYNFQLEVTDNEGATATDEAKVIVSSANIPPDVFAGNDVNLVLPTNSVDITGTANDADGTIVSTTWSQTGGAAATFSQTGNTISISGLSEGSYTFQFSATDDASAVSSDDVDVVVTASNVLPTVNAGPNISITLPTNSTNLNGSATDPDGTVSSFAWSQQSGPAAATLSNQNTPTLSVSGLVEGTYVFRLTATDNDGGSASDNTQVNVLPESVNVSPTANAGPNINLVLPTNTTNVEGTGADSDGSIVSYLWQKLSGPAATITNQNNPTATLSNLLEGSYVFRLTVTDNEGAIGTDDMKVTVSPAAINQTPTANAGADIVLTLPTNSTNLNGTGNDPDGSITSYLWQQSSGPNLATISNPNLATTSISSLVEGIYTFTLTVEDDMGSQDDDEVLVTVQPASANQKPIANAGADQILNLPTNSINLNGSGSDPDGTVVSYLWVKKSGPTLTLTNNDQPTVSLGDLIEGTYRLTLTVTDDEGEEGSDDVIVQVFPESVNQAPVVDVGPDVNIILPENGTTVTATVSDSDGSISSIDWSQVSGPSTATLTDTDQLEVSIADLSEGTYRFRLVATDDEGASGADDVLVNVLPVGSNTPPIANAGPNKEVYLPENSVTLTGFGSDENGSIASYLWEKVSGPSLTIGTNNTAETTLSNLVEGDYTLRLTVTDNEGASHADETSVKVFAAGTNRNPTVSAGDDIILNLPESSTTIEGIANDVDGSIASYEWSVLTGPNTPVLNGQLTSTLSISDLILGEYSLELKVEDNDGLSAVDDLIIYVEEEETLEDQSPIVNAGEDLVITLPNNEVTLIGSIVRGIFIESYKWSQLSGSTVALTGADKDTLNITGLSEGNYEFEFVALDLNGLSGSDRMSISVVPEGTTPNNIYPQKIFSPNGDNISDFWIYDPDPETIRECEIKIFDKRGIEVFNTRSYSNDWNGTSNGQELPEGVYYYILRCESGSGKTGSITLIK